MRDTGYSCGMAGHSVDEYLETIYFLAFPIGEYRPDPNSSTAIASRVAEMLGVSRASAGEMLKRLEADGLVERGEQKEAILTDIGDRSRREGRAQAPGDRAPADRLHGLHGRRGARPRRRVLGDTFSDDMVERIEEKLGHPKRCPHGWPIDPAFEQAENKELAPLADLKVGQEAEIVRLAEHDGELLHWFYDEGFVPGARVVIRKRSRPPPSSRSCCPGPSGRSPSGPPQGSSSGPPSSAAPRGCARSCGRSTRS